MSNVGSFYCNKLSNKSFSFELKQFFDLCFVLAVQVGCTDNISINYCCIVRQKEFSRKTADSKIKSFSWNQFSSDNSCLNQSRFFYSTSFGCFLEHLRSLKMNHNIMAKVQK